MTFVFFISIILPDISLAINKSKYLILILRYINARLTSLFAWTLFGVLGRTFVKAVYWKTETESFCCFQIILLFSLSHMFSQQNCSSHPHAVCLYSIKENFL